MTLLDIAFIAGAYFIGAVPFAYIVAKLVGGVDIRTVGSGNVGATNVGRTLGRKWGILVFFLDGLKGFLPTFAAWGLYPKATGLPPVVALTGLAAIAGHNWPVYLRFKGGKGMATSAGVFLAIFPAGVGIAFGVWAAVVLLTRYVSVASICAAMALLMAALLQPDPYGAGRYLTAFSALAAVLAIVRHRSNIGRLLRGEENKVGSGKRAA